MEQIEGAMEAQVAGESVHACILDLIEAINPVAEKHGINPVVLALVGMLLEFTTPGAIAQMAFELDGKMRE